MCDLERHVYTDTCPECLGTGFNGGPDYAGICQNCRRGNMTQPQPTEESYPVYDCLRDELCAYMNEARVLKETEARALADAQFTEITKAAIAAAKEGKPHVRYEKAKVTEYVQELLAKHRLRVMPSEAVPVGSGRTNIEYVYIEWHADTGAKHARV